MLFNSIDFMVFFPIVLSIYFLIPRKLRSVWALAASYFFYMSWNPQYAALIALSTLLTYAGGILVEKCTVMGGSSRNFWKKVVLVSCLAVNLLILGIFKYGNFVLESLDTALGVFGISMSGRRFDLLLPVGISFYTFQALGYIIDVYRGDTAAERNLLRYALFVSFFPQLVAGPIERSGNLLKQIQEMERIPLWNAKRITSGAILMVWGLFLKMVIADRVSVLFHHCSWGCEDYGGYTDGEFLCAVFCSFRQRLLEPLHISLSSWFKDYLYIPLGGSRKGSFRKALNKMIVFSVSGLWHGADWSFMAWGGLHSFYQVFADTTLPYRKKYLDKLQVNQHCFSWKLLQGSVTFVLVDFAWIFFRSDSVRDALYYIKRIFIRPTP